MILKTQYPITELQSNLYAWGKIFNTIHTLPPPPQLPYKPYPNCQTQPQNKNPTNFKNKKNGLQLVNRHTWRSLGMFYFSASVNPWSLKILLHHVHCWLVSYTYTARNYLQNINGFCRQWQYINKRLYRSPHAT